MTAVEARNNLLWSLIPIEIKNKIEDMIKYYHIYKTPFIIEIYQSVDPFVFFHIDKTIDCLKELGYGVETEELEYMNGEKDIKLIIKF